MTKRAVAYIDGHNFYHGCMKDSPQFKWLDLASFANALLGRAGAVDLVKYYTARVADLGDPSQSQRQDIYLAALDAIGGVQTVHGRMAKRKKPVRYGGKIVKATVWEEKGTDVNLGVDLVNDSRDDMTIALVISNDSDLQRSLDIARPNGVTVYVANPHARSNQNASLTGDRTCHIRRHHLADHQLPDVVGSAAGALRRPAEWA